MVVNAQLKKEVFLEKIRESNFNVNFELELFPAALLDMWNPVHIALFRNGQVVITGVKSIEKANEIVTLLSQYIDIIHSHSQE